MGRKEKMRITFCLLLLLGAGCASKQEQDDFTSYDGYCRSFRKVKPEAVTRQGILTLEKAQQIALDNNPDYQAAYASVQAAKYRYYRSLSAYLPEIQATGNATHSLIGGWDLKNPPDDVFPDENQFRSKLVLETSLLLFDGLEREFRALSAKYFFRKSAAEDDNVRRLLIRGVAFAYYDVILAKEKERIARSDMSFQLSSLHQAENRYRNGHVSKAAVLNFKILVNRAKSAIISARYSGKTAGDALCALMGFPNLDPHSLVLSKLTIPDTPPVLFSEMACINMAIRRRPDLAAQRFLLHIAKYNYFSAWSAMFPTARFFAGISYFTNESKLHGTDVKHSYYEQGSFSYGIRSEWNLFRGFADWNRIREYQARRLFSRYNLEQFFLRVVNEVQDAYANYQNQLHQLEIFREELQWVYEQRELIRTEYWAGKNTITRLNEAQRDVVNAEAKLAITAINLQKSIVQLNASVNRELRTLSAHDVTEPESGVLLEKFLNAIDKYQAGPSNEL